MTGVRFVTTKEDIETIRALFTEYEASLGIDLTFQQFREELVTLPGDYAAPYGCLILAFNRDGPVGCAAVRKISDEICELKRMYVRPQHRGAGAGKILAATAIEFARQNGYRRMRLDTLPTMNAAIALYRAIGFYEIPPYRFNPIQGTLYMEITL